MIRNENMTGQELKQRVLLLGEVMRGEYTEHASKDGGREHGLFVEFADGRKAGARADTPALVYDAILGQLVTQ